MVERNNKMVVVVVVEMEEEEKWKCCVDGAGGECGDDETRKKTMKIQGRDRFNGEVLADWGK